MVFALCTLLRLSDVLTRFDLKGKRRIIHWILRGGLKSPARQEAMAYIFLFLLLAILHLLQYPAPNLAMGAKANELLSISRARLGLSLNQAPALREKRRLLGRYLPGLARFKRCGDTSRAKLDILWHKGRISALYALLRFSDILAYFGLKRRCIMRSLLLVAGVFVLLLLLLVVLWLFPAPNVAIAIEAKARNSMRKARIRSEFRGY